MKLFKTILILTGLSILNSVNATEIRITPPTLDVKTPSLSARFIEPTDSEDISHLHSLSYPVGLPENPISWAGNHMTRRNGGNYYNCLMIMNKSDESVAALGYGRMPVLNYEPRFTDILDTYQEFGVIKQKDLGGGYEKDNFERVDNFGIGFILPIIPTNLSEEVKKEIIQLGTEVFQEFKKREFLLPLEKTIPHDLIALLSPQDPLVEIFQKVGFELLKKDGFFGFYDSDRVMLHKVL